MKRTPLKVRVALAAGLLVAATVCVPTFAWRWREYRLTRQVESIQAALERYHHQHGTYPESLSTATIPDPEEIYYRREVDGTYLIYFGMELGESIEFRPLGQKR